MILSVEVIFFVLTSLFLVHTYILYPVSVYILSIFFTKRITSNPDYQPKVSIIISVYNEEKVIEKTIRNFLKSDYDLSKIQFVIGSDNSSDKTNEIIESLSKEVTNIDFYPFKERRGKARVINDLVKSAKGEIIIFSDANTMYSPDAIKKIVKYYSDERVGGVSGRLVLLNHEKAIESGNQETKYWQYENWIKESEGKLGCLIGANGGIYSIRKALFLPLPLATVADDFTISLRVLEQGKLFVYEKSATAEEESSDITNEYKRKIRINTMNFYSLQYMKEILQPKYGLVSYGLWSHKMIRWFSPVFMIILFISNFLLWRLNSFYEYFFYIQLVFYTFSLLGYLLKKIRVHFILFALCFYFTYMNLALLIGMIKFLMKKQSSFWQSTERA